MSEFESFFGDTDIDDVPDNPNELPNNTYKFRVISAIFDKTRAGDKVGITFKYQITEGSWSSFFPLTEWVRIPEKTLSKSDRQRYLSYLKMRLIAFGFTPEEVQAFGINTVEECVGREFYGTTSLRKDGERTNIRVVKFDPIEDGGILDGSDDDPVY